MAFAPFGTTTGSWSSPDTLTYSYQWERCSSTGKSCVAITHATQSSYKLTSADVGHRVTVVVTAKDQEAQTGRATATAVGSVINAVRMDRRMSWSRCASHGRPIGRNYRSEGSAFRLSDPMRRARPRLHCRHEAATPSGARHRGRGGGSGRAGSVRLLGSPTDPSHRAAAGRSRHRRHA